MDGTFIFAVAYHFSRGWYEGLFHKHVNGSLFVADDSCARSRLSRGDGGGARSGSGGDAGGGAHGVEFDLARVEEVFCRWGNTTTGAEACINSTRLTRC